MTPNRRAYVYLAAWICGLVSLGGALILTHQVVAAWASGAGFEIIPWLWVTLAALALWAVHWTLAAKAASPATDVGVAERRSPARKAYLYLMQFAALATGVMEGARLVGGGVARAVAPAVTPVVSPMPWPEWPMAPALGVLIALIVWGFHRRVTLRDGDFGAELGRAAGWRRVYFYTATALGAALIAFGAVQLIRAALALGGELALSSLPAAISWSTLVVTALTALAIGIPLAVLSWHTGSQPGYLSPATEVHALSRVAFLRLGALLSTLAALVSLVYVLRQLFLVVFGERIGQSQTLWTAAMATAVAVAPVGVAMWLAFMGALQNDAARVREIGAAAAGRRAHFYLISAITLVGFWYGLTQLLRAILPLGLDALSSLDVNVVVSLGRLSLAAALVLAAAPVWWGHWWPMHVRARRFTDEGYAERASPLRRAYLLVFIFVAAALIVLSLALLVYALLGGRLPFEPQDGIVGVAAGALATGSVAVGWWLVHLLTLRADRKAQATWERVQKVMAAPSATPAPGVRSYPREELGALPAIAAAERAVLRPVVVVDCGDGALGAILVTALRTALPRAVIWPVGLNPGAQATMSRALGHRTPFAPPPDALARAAVVIGPTDVLFLEEEGGAMRAGLAAALSGGKARVLLLPPRGGQLRWVAAPDWPAERWSQYVVAEAAEILNRPG